MYIVHIILDYKFIVELWGLSSPSYYILTTSFSSSHNENFDSQQFKYIYTLF
jgi:hypothetical protein